MIGVFIDGNVWNFLYERHLDLAVELPAPEFAIMHTREAEFEIPVGKPDLDDFIRKTMQRCNVRTDSIFGFADDTKSLNEQRFGGFDQGRFAAPEEIDFMLKYGTSGIVRPTKLQKHEADISLAAKSFHSIVLTLDKRSSPLRAARGAGGKVVWLNDIDQNSLTLATYVRAAIEHRTDEPRQ
ncbi:MULTISPECIES: hypothetical protein [Afipia]|jgi:hypothetical protein|uniref:PIN domain-containing protein n=1 Tax=Afipia massiliensis TaxID=211460 RepID=A0A840N4W3_9BRAD|nr:MULTISPECIES: hypothetical protein [Afipia]MBB5053597.1 hypothetical protein [Afipia massiliensis]WIG52226.1 MAG: hypothetical protein OJF48_003144 [Afipia sp.]